MTEPAVKVALPNVGPGPDSLALTDPVAPADPTTVDERDAADETIVLLLHRDHHAGQCRRQVRAVADRDDEFRERGCAVVPVAAAHRSRTIFDRPEIDALLAHADRRF